MQHVSVSSPQVQWHPQSFHQTQVSLPVGSTPPVILKKETCFNKGHFQDHLDFVTTIGQI